MEMLECERQASKQRISSGCSFDDEAEGRNETLAML